MPRHASIGGYFHSADNATAVIGGGSGNDRHCASHDCGAARRRGDDGNGRGRVRGLRGGEEARLQRSRLCAHVRQMVDGSLLHAYIRRRPCIVLRVVRAIETPGPLHGARAKHQRMAGGAVHRQVMRRLPGAVDSPIVKQQVRRHTIRRRGKTKEPGRAEAVVRVNIPFEPEGARGKGSGLAGCLCRYGRIAPEAHLAVGGGDQNGEVVVISPKPVDREGGPGERVFGAASVGRWAEAGIAPSSRPRCGIGGVGFHAGQRFLVAHQRAIGHIRTIDAVFPTRLPEKLVAAEERHIHSRVARGFHVGAARPRRIFVMPRRDVGLVIGDQAAAARRVHPGEIRHVVAVGFQPPDHRILSVKYPRGGFKGPRVEGPVVADLERARAQIEYVGGTVEIGAAKIVICLPGFVRSLVQHVGMARVITHDEGYVAVALRVGSNQMRKIDSGDRARWNGPRRRNRPVAAVHQFSGSIAEARRLRLRQRCRRRDAGHFARAHPAVVTHAVNVDRIRRRGGFDLEKNGLAGVDADIRGEALNAGVAGAVAGDVPFARIVARQAVLRHYRVRRRTTIRPPSWREGAQAQQRHQNHIAHSSDPAILGPSGAVCAVGGLHNFASVSSQHGIPSFCRESHIVGILEEVFAALATAKANAEKNLQNALSPQGSGWFRTRIGEQMILQRGFDITKHPRKPGRVPVVSSRGVKSFHDTPALNRNPVHPIGV